MGHEQMVITNWMQIDGEVFAPWCGSCVFFCTKDCLDCTNDTMIHHKKKPTHYKGGRTFENNDSFGSTESDSGGKDNG